MVSQYYKISNKSGRNNSIKPFQLYLCVYVLAFGLFLNSAIQIILGIWLVELVEYDCGSTKTSKTCSKDQIYRKLVYEDDAFLLIEVKVELDKFVSIY